MPITASNTSNSSLFYVYGISLVASVGGFLFGFDLVIISGALLFLEQDFQLTASMKGILVSSAALGAISGPLIGWWFADKIGRRKTMMLAAAFFAISAIGSALAFNVWDLCFWRFLGGIGIGLAMMSSPVYIAELSPPHLRGKLVNVNQLSNVIGINLAVIVGYFFSFEGQWRWMFASEGVPILLLILGLMMIPESPRWLADNNNDQEALRVLTKINGEQLATQELREIKKSSIQQEGTFQELLVGKNRGALVVAIILMVFSQINGVNMILLYAPTILAETGIGSGSNAILGVIPVYGFILLCTMIAFPLIKKFSRRSLLLWSVSGMAAGHILMAVIILAGLPSITILIPMLIATGAFTLGFAPLSWIITSEIFPNKVRSKGMAIACFFLYISSFLITLFFPILSEAFTSTFGNTAGIYLLFTLICLSCVIYSWYKVPETKGVSLENVEEIWKSRKEKEGH